MDRFLVEKIEEAEKGLDDSSICVGCGSNNAGATTNISMGYSPNVTPFKKIFSYGFNLTLESYVLARDKKRHDVILCKECRNKVVSQMIQCWIPITLRNPRENDLIKKLEKRIHNQRESIKRFEKVNEALKSNSNFKPWADALLKRKYRIAKLEKRIEELERDKNDV